MLGWRRTVPTDPTVFLCTAGSSVCGSLANRTIAGRVADVNKHGHCQWDKPGCGFNSQTLR